MQIVVEVAKGARASSSSELCEIVKDEHPSIFATSRYDASQDTFVTGPSVEAVRRAVTLCRVLNLITEGGMLTPKGREAARRSRFSCVVGEEVGIMLAGKGVKFEMLNDIIRRKLHSEPPVLPTSEVLWNELQPEMSRGLFSRLLTLLVHSECGQSSQRKVFLAFGNGSDRRLGPS